MLAALADGFEISDADMDIISAANDAAAQANAAPAAADSA